MPILGAYLNGEGYELPDEWKIKIANDNQFVKIKACVGIPLVGEVCVTVVFN